MTLLNRSLSKAYHRQSIAPVTVVNKSAGVAVDARGWVPELRAPQRPPEPLPVWSWPPICRKLLDAAGDGFRKLADQLLATSLERKFKTVALTGTAEGVGTTSILLTLAQTIADGGAARVLLVDADFSRPELAAQLSISPQASWCEAVGKNTADEKMLLPLDGERLFLLSLARPIDPVAIAGLSPEAVSRFFAPLRERFDLILFDGGNWENITQRPLWNPQVVDAIICVTEEASHKTPIDQYLSHTRQTGIEFLGVIETFR